MGASGGATDPSALVSADVNSQVVEQVMSTAAVVAGRATFEPADGRVIR